MVNNSTNVNETETQIIEHKKTKMEKETARIRFHSKRPQY
jgi:hypothetical protein